MLLEYILQRHVDVSEVSFHLQKEALNLIIASLAMLSCFDWPFEILVGSQQTPFHVDVKCENCELDGESLHPRTTDCGESKYLHLVITWVLINPITYLWLGQHEDGTRLAGEVDWKLSPVVSLFYGTHGNLFRQIL